MAAVLQREPSTPKPGLFNQVPREFLVALAGSRLRPVELAVVLAISVRVYEQGREKGTVAKAISFEWLAQQCHVTRRNAWRAVEGLEHANVISVERGERHGPRNPVNLYRIQPPQWWSIPTRSPVVTGDTRLPTRPVVTPVTPPVVAGDALRKKDDEESEQYVSPTCGEQPVEMQDWDDELGDPGPTESSESREEQRHAGHREETPGRDGAGDEDSKGKGAIGVGQDERDRDAREQYVLGVTASNGTRPR